MGCIYIATDELIGLWLKLNNVTRDVIRKGICIRAQRKEDSTAAHVVKKKEIPESRVWHIYVYIYINIIKLEFSSDFSSSLNAYRVKSA